MNTDSDDSAKSSEVDHCAFDDADCWPFANMDGLLSAMSGIYDSLIADGRDFEANAVQVAWRLLAEETSVRPPNNTLG
jgi:hypothetical protein